MWTRSKKTGTTGQKGGFASLCRVSPSATATIYMESFHVEVPASSTEPQRAPTAWSLCRGGSFNTVSPPIFSLLVAGLQWAAFKSAIENKQREGDGVLRPPAHHYRSKTHCIFLYLTSLLPSANTVSSEQFKRIYCFSSQCWFYRLPLCCRKILWSCMCGIQSFLLGKEQHCLNTKPEVVLWIHAGLHRTSHVESQLQSRQVRWKCCVRCTAITVLRYELCFLSNTCYKTVI